MIKLSWLCHQDADCDTFRVYRAITGIIVNFPNSLVAGNSIKFSATSPVPQEISFPAVDIDSVLARINLLGKGVRATKNLAGDKLFIRCTATTDAKFILKPCNFAVNTAQTPRIITPALEWVALADIARVVDTFAYDYTDADGDQLDRYRTTTLKSSAESIPSVITTPALAYPAMCILEGRVIDSSNHPVVGARVQVEIRIDPAMADKAVMAQGLQITATDEFGRFALPLIQNQAYLLQVPAVGYNEVVVMPAEQVANLMDLVPTTAHRFSPFEDPQ